MPDLETFRAKAAGLIAAVNEFGEKYGLQGLVAADHIGHKCESREVFEYIRAMLEPESNFVYQSYISGRRIALFKLKEYFITNLGEIATLELNDQKPDNSQKTGFDHIEIYPLDGNYDALVKNLEGQGVMMEKEERPHHTTYDIILAPGMKLKLTRERLLEKVKRDEME